MKQFQKTILIPLLIAILLFMTGYKVFTCSDLARMHRVQTKIYAFVQEHVARYDAYKANDEVKSLYRLLDKTTELRQKLEEETYCWEEMIPGYLYDQRLSGILILDDAMNCVYQTGEMDDADTFWGDMIQSNVVRDILQYPKKTYMTRIEKGGDDYDFTAVARTDAPGIVIAYERKRIPDGKNGDIAIGTLFQGFTFDLDGVVVITDGINVLSSNNETLQNRSVAECRMFYKWQFSPDTNNLVRLKAESGCWYGGRKKIKNYQIYVFFPRSEVFSFRNKILVAGEAVYALGCMGFFLFRDRLIRENMRQLKEAAQQAECANIAKTDFLRRMSHDVRTPINGIQGMVEICRHYMDDHKKLEECLDKIVSASGFLLDLVNDVLDMNKLESGKIQLESKPFDLLELLTDADSLLEIQARENGVEFIRRNPELMHTRYMGSPLHIRQILQNIGTNAIRYNHENGWVSVGCKELYSDGETTMIELTCEDNGKGMSEEFQMHAFEPFAQEDSSARTAYSGTGLGLAISKKLVDLLGGTIRFQSEPGKGTTFTITFPLEIDNQDLLENAPQDQTESIQGLHILLVEDNDLNMEILRFILEKHGAIVTGAWNGKEAVEQIQNTEPGTFDIVFMDIRMPVMNGLEAVQEIRNMNREDAKTLPVIAMSANAFSDDIERSLKAGMNAHVSKPLDAQMMIRAVNENRLR